MNTDASLADESASPPVASTRVFRPGGRGPTTVAPADITPCNFRNPAFLTEGELRRLRLQQEEFARYLASRLSLFLRLEVSVSLTELSTPTYGAFTGSLAAPAHLGLFKMEPLRGVGILATPSRLALGIVDRLLGGRGQLPAAARSLTEIEIALFEEVEHLVLEEWGGAWKSPPALQPTLIGHESSGRFLQTAPREAVMLVLTLEVGLGEEKESLRLGLPDYTIEPLMKAWQARRQQEAAPVAAAPKKSAWQPVYQEISLPVRAEWHAFEIPLREVTSLRVGDIVELPVEIVEQTRVLLNGSIKFIGTAGLEGERVVVRLDQPLASAEPLTVFPHGG